MSRSAPHLAIDILTGPPGPASGAHTLGKPTSTIERAGMAPDGPAPPLPAASEPVPDARSHPADPSGAPARTATSRRNPLLALIHDETDHSVLGTVMAGMAGALSHGQLALVLQPLLADTAATRLREFLRRYRPAGVVLLPPLCARDDLVAVCAAAQIPCVRLGVIDGGAGMACDQRRAAGALVAWLIEQGHSRIGFVAGPEGSASAQQRELGYMDAMADNGLDRGPALIVPGDHSFESGIEAGRLLLELSPRPSAIVASNDEMAVGVLHAAAQMGVSVPTELSVAGFDDTPLAARSLPPLTTVHLPWEQMAREAVRQIITGQAVVSALTGFSTRLVVRDSVQPPSP